MVGFKPARFRKSVPSTSKAHITWYSIALASAFIGLAASICLIFRLKIGSSLVISAARCVIQLGFLAFVLKSVFDANDPWTVAGITLLLNFLGALETVVNGSPRRYSHMFSSVFLSMIVSTIPVSLFTTRYIMDAETFWKPNRYIPLLGMLAGHTVSGIAISLMVVLQEVQDNEDKIETSLAFGASRLEASRPIVQEALLVALIPVISLMGVTGLISIPGMMTGALLGGGSVDQATRLQMVIMFCTCACTALGSIVATLLCLHVIIDSQHRIRIDRIDAREHLIWRMRHTIVNIAMRKMSQLLIIIWKGGSGHEEENTIGRLNS